MAYEGWSLISFQRRQRDGKAYMLPIPVRCSEHSIFWGIVDVVNIVDVQFCDSCGAFQTAGFGARCRAMSVNFRFDMAATWCGINWTLVERANLRGVLRVIGQTALSNFPVTTDGRHQLNRQQASSLSNLCKYIYA